jgi:anti-anti-sigma regulatory factor
MNTPSASMFVLVGEQFACIKIIGRANFTSSIDFKTLVNELRQKGYNYFVLDLSECALMDSTFLGVLAGLGLKMGGQNRNSCEQALELLNPNARITELLESLGVLHLFKISHGALTLPEQTQISSYTPQNPTREEVTRACIEAHNVLMEINPDNVARFKEVAQFLAEDLKKLKSPAN